MSKIRLLSRIGGLVSCTILFLSLMYQRPFAISTGSTSLDGLLVILSGLSGLIISSLGYNKSTPSFADEDHLATDSPTKNVEAMIMRMAMDNADEAIVVTEAQSLESDGPRIVFANKTYADLAGHPAEDLIGRPATLLGHQGADETMTLGFHETLQRGQSLQTEVLFYNINHDQTWLDLRVFPLRAPNGSISHYAAFARDIGDQKEVEAQMRSEKEHAEASSRLKSEFLATMSHEIRTPLNGIIGMSNLLADTALDDSQRRHVDMLMTSADTLLHLINDILDLSKIEADRLELEPVNFDLKNLVFELVDMVRQQIGRKGLELVVDIDPELPRQICADPGRVRQIILNLLSNAIKFTNEGHIYLHVNQPAHETSLIEIIVEDTGVGIAPNAQEKVFEKFSQEDASTTRRYGGTGLGLAICKQLSELLGGSITLKSEEGSGSRFTFSFSYQPVSSTTVQNTWLKNKADRDGLVGKRVIMIDDLTACGDSVGRYLRSLNVETRLLHRLNRLSSDLSRWHSQYGMPDLIIIDETPGIGTPCDVMTKLKHVLGADLPPILLLATEPLQGRHQALAAMGLSGAIEKPVRPSHLTRATSALISDHTPNMFWTPHPDLDISQPRDGDHQAAQPFAGLQVLLAEDNMINAQIFTHMMERWGARVTIAGNGQEAVEIACSMSFDIIFMDCQMPDLDGYGATRELRQFMKDGAVKPTPIIALTANAMKGDRERCLTAGMDDYLSKPAQARDIARKIQHWTNQQTGEPSAHPSTDIARSTALESNLVDLALYNECADILGPSHAKVVIDFIERLGHMLQELAFAIKQHDFQRTAKLVHPFKSSSAQIGAIGIAKLCRRIEMRTRDKSPYEVDLDDLVTLLMELKGISDQTSNLLATMIHEDCQPALQEEAS